MARRPTVPMKRMGVTWEERDSRAAIDGNADAPIGKVFTASGTHTLAVHDWTSRADGWADLTERLGYGLEDCADADCEVCPDNGAIWDGQRWIKKGNQA